MNPSHPYRSCCTHAVSTTVDTSTCGTHPESEPVRGSRSPASLPQEPGGPPEDLAPWRAAEVTGTPFFGYLSPVPQNSCLTHANLQSGNLTLPLTNTLHRYDLSALLRHGRATGHEAETAESTEWMGHYAGGGQTLSVSQMPETTG